MWLQALECKCFCIPVSYTHTLAQVRRGGWKVAAADANVALATLSSSAPPLSSVHRPPLAADLNADAVRGQGEETEGGGGREGGKSLCARLRRGDTHSDFSSGGQITSWLWCR
jgi:hypothetical protein